MPSGVYIRTEKHRENISKANKGKKKPLRSLEHRKNISINMLKRWQNPEYIKKMKEAHIGQIAWNIGFTKETDERVAKYGKKSGESRIGLITWNKGLTALTDERIRKGKHWRGGISNLPYSFEFNSQLKELIRHRDEYKCRLCGMPEMENNQRLSIHHIDYDKKNSKPNNLIALCIKCNSKVNQNRDEWEIHFKKKIEKIMSKSKIKLNPISKIEEKRSKNVETFIQ